MTATKFYETVWDRFVGAQEGQARLAQSLFEDTVAILITQAERNLSASEKLAEQARRGHKAGRVLAQGSADAYAQFLDSLFLYYRESVRLGQRSVEEE